MKTSSLARGVAVLVGCSASSFIFSFDSVGTDIHPWTSAVIVSSSVLSCLELKKVKVTLEGVLLDLLIDRLCLRYCSFGSIWKLWCVIRWLTLSCVLAVLCGSGYPWGFLTGDRISLEGLWKLTSVFTVRFFDNGEHDPGLFAPRFLLASLRMFGRWPITWYGTYSLFLEVAWRSRSCCFRCLKIIVLDWRLFWVAVDVGFVLFSWTLPTTVGYLLVERSRFVWDLLISASLFRGGDDKALMTRFELVVDSWSCPLFPFGGDITLFSLLWFTGPRNDCGLLGVLRCVLGWLIVRQFDRRSFASLL